MWCKITVTSINTIQYYFRVVFKHDRLHALSPTDNVSGKIEQLKAFTNEITEKEEKVLINNGKWGFTLEFIAKFSLLLIDAGDHLFT